MKWNLKCVVCGREFEGKRRDIKYCCDACKAKAYRDRRKQREKEGGIT